MITRRDRQVDLIELGELDPAGPADPESVASAPAQALLERVLASPADADTDTAWHGPPAARPRWSTPRLVLAGAAVVLLAVAAVVLPELNGGVADAWTARPGTLDGPATQAAAEECRDIWRASNTQDAPTEAELAAMVPLIAEHRGDVDLVVIGDGRWVASCLLDEGGRISGLSPPDFSATAPEPADDGVAWWFAAGSRTDSGEWRVAVVGRAGPDVAAVALHPQYGVEGVDVVHATLRDGWFIAFWPNQEDRDDVDPGTTPLTVTLRTGEVLRDVVVPWSEE